MQLAREEKSLEQKVREGQSQDDKRSQQSAVEQGVDKANERMQGEGKKSALFSPRSQRAMQDAKQKVSQATEKVTQSQNSGQQQANALAEAADALTKASASLSRDRENANNANSASGFSEMLQADAGDGAEAGTDQRSVAESHEHAQRAEQPAGPVARAVVGAEAAAARRTARRGR